MNNKRNLEFLYELGSLRNMQRGWIQHIATNCANDLEHTMRVVFLALIIARQENVKNEELIIKMALIHDMAESRVSDHSYVQKVYVQSNEEKAIHDTLDQTSLQDFENIVRKFEKRDCIEAKIVKDSDNLDIDLELKELDEQGHKLAHKWSSTRKKVIRENLYTKTAKDIWDEIQISEPSSWHLNANKYVKPEAGK